MKQVTAGEFWEAVLVIAAVLMLAAAIKISWKYNAPNIVSKLERLEKQNELMRQTLEQNDLITAGMQKKWDQTFIEKEDGE